MRIPGFARHGAALTMAVLMATLAATAPLVNAKGGPPRTVFLELPPEAEPTVSLDLAPLPGGGWQIRIDTTGFVFTSLCLSQAEAIPVGHAHVIVDGVKVASAYHPVGNLTDLGAGAHEVRVVLRGQDHRALIGSTGLIQAKVWVQG